MSNDNISRNKNENNTSEDRMPVYNVTDDVKCLKCSNIGAKKFAGNIKDGKLSVAMGFGGTIPWKCLNCDNSGLIDIDGLEGYKKAFETIKK